MSPAPDDEPTRTAFDPIAAARAALVPRVPLHIGGDGVVRHVGSVALAHLEALRRWPQWLAFEAVEAFEARGAGGAGGVTLLAPPAERDAALAAVNGELHALGLVRAWRDETFALFDPASGRTLARIERASARFWGTLTLGAHATGYVRDATGTIAGLWIAQRSLAKATDPGLHDNLVGGGVPVGQSPLEALVREGFEEAGLGPAEMADARAAGVLRLARDVAEGFQQEWLHAFDLELPAGRVPQNQDGEVAGFTLHSPAEAAELALSGAMTVDAALVTLDFLLRHRLRAPDHHAAGLDSLRVRERWAA